MSNIILFIIVIGIIIAFGYFVKTDLFNTLITKVNTQEISKVKDNVTTDLTPDIQIPTMENVI